MGETKHIPFSCGSQFTDWQASNCFRCTKYNPEGIGKCEIDKALLYASFDDGSVPEDIAERMGYLDNSPPRQIGFSYSWQCGEVDWTPEWIAEVNARKDEQQTLTIPDLETV